jgi:Quercetinase C-terminal cupin domain
MRLNTNLRPTPGAWLQVTRGVITLNRKRLEAGHAARVEFNETLAIAASADSARFCSI